MPICPLSRSISSLLTIALASTALAACSSASAQQGVAAASPPAVATAETAPARAKNVILFIGDGMGISTITAARIYAGQKRGETGEENVLSFERFENVALVKTYNTDAQVPDSAGTATAMNSGKKTRIGLIGVGPDTQRGDCASAGANPLPLIGEEAKRRGLSLGIVSTARLTHATPAAVYARSADRNWEADSAMPQEARDAGCIDIASQMIASDFDVALGGGRGSFFGNAGQGRRTQADADLPAQWVARTGGSYVETQAELAAAPADRPVFGLFSASHMAYMVDREADSTEPTLTDLTQSAISRLSGDEDGYYLMVESGRIDHAHHGSKAGYALEETVEFARAIQHAIDNTDPDETLILVTADHSHVFTIAGYPRRGNDILGLVVPPAGGGDDDHASDVPDSPTLAGDGKPYTTLGYANGPGAVSGERAMPATGLSAIQQSLIPLGSETHGGEDVALYGQGPGADGVRGVIEQNLIYDIMRRSFGWDTDDDAP